MIQLRLLPSVDKVLKAVPDLINKHGYDLVKNSIRSLLMSLRGETLKISEPESKEAYLAFILSHLEGSIKSVTTPSLRTVINCSGIILHTNLGRAPFGSSLLNDTLPVLESYTNLEFDTKKGQRGERNSHLVELLKYLTSAQDAVIVNNNAAAIMLILSVFAKNKQTVVSRGELIEVGGSFRIPDIMELSGTVLKEVGSTNKTRISDYQNAINPETAMLFKAHRSNFAISGFTQEVSLEELSGLGKANSLITVYDIGSGLLKKINKPELSAEPIVQEAIEAGIDLVCFSGDKLLGAAQAGIIVGKKQYISELKKHPLMRVLRVGKTTLALLQTACSYYLDDELLDTKNILFKTLSRTKEDIESAANAIAMSINDKMWQIQKRAVAQIESTKGQYGGGTLPNLDLPSYSVRLTLDSKEKNQDKGKEIYHALLQAPIPILSNLVKGEIYLDCLCVNQADAQKIADTVVEIYSKCVAR